MGNLKTPQWIEYKFTPESIEKDSLLQVKIPSLLNYCCSETFVDTINDGQIKLNYKFRVNENLVNKYDQKKSII